MKKRSIIWKLDKFLKMASGERGVKHSDATRMLHLLSKEIAEIAELAAEQGFIRVLHEKGKTKSGTVYKATGKQPEETNFIDVTEEYLASKAGEGAEGRTIILEGMEI